MAYGVYMKKKWIKDVRSALGITQADLAEAIGVSTKAVQSYEQGWRNVPAPMVSQILMLLAVHRDRTIERKPCWDVTSCPPGTRKKCPSFKVSRGAFCWFVSGKACGRKGEGRGSEANIACLDCAVVKRLLTVPSEA